MSNNKTGEMSKEEKGLLLEMILRDIRGNWGWQNGDRVGKARELAAELSLDQVINLIDVYDYEDGRHFREPFECGGYEGMEVIHGLPFTICDKSKEFQDEATLYLTYPEYAFDDYEQFSNPTTP
jgi:hypothetical protein